MHKNFYQAGSYNSSCDVCGQKYKSSEIRKRWDNAIVCINCYEPKHPVLMPLPAVVDQRTILNARPKQYETEIAVSYGRSLWGTQYVNIQGLQPDLNWEAWSETWDGDREDDDFILGI